MSPPRFLAYLAMVLSIAGALKVTMIYLVGKSSVVVINRIMSLREKKNKTKVMRQFIPDRQPGVLTWPTVKVQAYLAYKKLLPLRTLQQAYA